MSLLFTVGHQLQRCRLCSKVYYLKLRKDSSCSRYLIFVSLTISCRHKPGCQLTVTSRPGSFSAYTIFPLSIIIAYLAVLSPILHPMFFENLASGSVMNSLGDLSASGLCGYAGYCLTMSLPLIPLAFPQALITQASLKAITAT